MKIYIYGNQSFKKEIHETLEHSNIKFKLDNNTVIEEISTLEKLKRTIENNPNDIYLIDDEKIIKKNSLNKRIKFLTPKDGIEEEYLLDSGIADLSIDSLKELPKYIIQRYEELKALEPEVLEIQTNEKKKKSSIELDDELLMLLSKEEEGSNSFDNSDDMFDLEKNVNLDNIDGLKETNDFADVMNFNDDFGLNNISFDYDDEDVLYKEESDEPYSISEVKSSASILEELDFLGQEVTEEDEDITDLDKINNDLFGGFDFLNEEIHEGINKAEFIAEQKKEENEQTEENEEFSDMDVIDSNPFSGFDFLNEEILESEKIDESGQGEEMNDEFYELDSLNEKDLIEALNYKVEIDSSKREYVPVVSEGSIETLNINGSNTNDLSALISKLLNNKTLEITIKIKD